MSASTVIQKIEEKAAAQCAEIARDGEQKAAAVRDQIHTDTDKRIADLQAQTDMRADLIMRAAAQQAASDNKIVVLNHKDALLKDARKAAKAQMLALPDNERRALLEKWIAENCDGYATELHFSERDAQLFVASKKDFGKNVTIGSIDKEIDGGLVLSTEQYDIDLSFDAVLDMIFEQHEAQFANCLFSENEGSV
ncbi:MAG: V-type ATP synthase subunit E [Candidatus Fimenecus sp.]